MLGSVQRLETPGYWLLLCSLYRVLQTVLIILEELEDRDGCVVCWEGGGDRDRPPEQRLLMRWHRVVSTGLLYT